MPKKIVEEKPITIVEARTVLEGLSKELNQFQRRTLDYTLVFSKLDVKKMRKVKDQLMKILDLSEKEAVAILNCMPETVEELRVFIPRHKLTSTEQLQEALNALAQAK